MHIEFTTSGPKLYTGVVYRTISRGLIDKLLNEIPLPDYRLTDEFDYVRHYDEITIKRSEFFAIRATIDVIEYTNAYGYAKAYTTKRPGNCIGHVTVTPIGDRSYAFSVTLV
mgnify:CR=1 FL=1